MLFVDSSSNTTTAFFSANCRVDGTPGIGPAVRVDFAAFGESLPSSKLDYGCSSDPAGGLLNELDTRREPKLRVDVREVRLHGPG